MIKLADPKKSVDEEIIEAVTQVLKSGNYILGNRTKEFEQSIASFLGCSTAVAVSSGTSALHLALLACGIGKGDEVITTPHTFIATINAISHAGAKPVLVDVEEETHNIDPSRIEAAITGKTKAILPVHIYGNPADMDPIMEVAERRGLVVIEDACQAIGAEYKRLKAGTIGDAGCFSFFPSKVMTVCGDGGMICTSKENVSSKAVMLRNQGRGPGEKYSHDGIGFNFRISELAATIGSIQLKRLAPWMERRTAIAKKYDSLLAGIEEVKTPVAKEGVKPSFYVYTIMVPKDRRDELSKFLKANCIESGIYYPIPINRQPAYRDMNLGSFPVAERIASEIISLPMHQFLEDSEVDAVCDKVREFFSQ